jgi:CRP/FNR family transcriptional regulator
MTAVRVFPDVNSGAEAVWAGRFGQFQRQVYPARVDLFVQSEALKEVIYLEEGVVKLWHLNEQGQETGVSLRCGGSLIGTSWIILGKPPCVTATTTTLCHLRRLPAADFLAWIESDSSLMRELLKQQCAALIDLTTRLVKRRHLSARERVEQFLFDMATGEGSHRLEDPVRLILPLNQGELAELLCLSREHFSRVLNRLEFDGLIARKKTGLTILKPRKLFHLNC